jgi:hypothetical protein
MDGLMACKDKLVVKALKSGKFLLPERGLDQSDDLDRSLQRFPISIWPTPGSLP